MSFANGLNAQRKDTEAEGVIRKFQDHVCDFRWLPELNFQATSDRLCASGSEPDQQNLGQGKSMILNCHSPSFLLVRIFAGSNNFVDLGCSRWISHNKAIM